MGKRTICTNAILTGLLGLVIVSYATPADAWWPRRHSLHHHGPEVKYRRSLPRAYTTIYIDGLAYFYDSGVFYRRGRSGYVLITAPIGAVVPVLPPYHQTVLINGRTYYTYDNVYYMPCPRGYKVVQFPTVKAPQIEAVTDSEETFVVNVPNANGSYTPVVITHSGDSYIGPQGEYYDTQPTIDQLKAMYGK